MRLNERLPGAPDFTYGELIHSDTAERLGIDNTPEPAQRNRLAFIAERGAQPARDALGPIKVTSGFRSRALNEALGGSPNSAHMYGAALDLVPLETDVARLALWMADHLPEWNQIIYERRRGREWVHVSLWLDRPNRGELRRHLPEDGARYPFITREALELLAP